MKPNCRHLRLTAGAVLMTSCILLFGCGKAPKQETTAPASKNDEITRLVRDFLSAEKKWDENAYRIVDTDRRDEAGNYIVDVIHEDDEKSAVAGGGKSVRLHVDVKKKKVVKELHFQ
jgi:hypothetical protein